MLQSRRQGKIDGTIIGVILFRLTVLFWWSRSPSRPGTKSSTSFWWKFSSEKIILDWVRHVDPEIGAKKFRICIDWVATRTWISKDDNYWKPINGQTKLCVRVHLCSQLEMKIRLHQDCHARSCHEIEELRRRCYREENGATQQKLNEYSIQHDQESRTASSVRDQIRKLQERLEFIEDLQIFQDPDSPSSFGSAPDSHQAVIP